MTACCLFVLHRCRWLGHPKCFELHEHAAAKGGRLTNLQVRDWLLKQPEHLRAMGIEPQDFTNYHIDHIFASAAKGTSSRDHPMNLCVMRGGQNSSFGAGVTLAKCQYVGLRVWCAVLCWHGLTVTCNMGLQEAMQLAHELTASPHEFLEQVKEHYALAA
jgi:hypothetical protein